MIGFFVFLFAAAFGHVFIEGDHLWTGEGARFSWSMRLKGKVCRYSVKTSKDASEWAKPDFSRLTDLQVVHLEDPLFLLQFVQQTYCLDRKEIYVRALCRAIGYQPQLLIDPERNLCQVSYHNVWAPWTWGHNDWIHPHPGNWDSDYATWFGGTWGRGIR